MFKILSMMTVAAALLCNTNSWAADQSPGLKNYGDGVHAYFDGEYQAANKKFDQAIKSDLKGDPRAYYFRGLSSWMLGDQESAKADFKLGADYEAKDTNVFYPVSRSLVRVQGEVRLLIEQYRKQGFADKQMRDLKLAKQRYNATKAQDAEILKKLSQLNKNDNADDDKVADDLFGDSDNDQEVIPEIPEPKDDKNPFKDEEPIKPSLPEPEKENPLDDLNPPEDKKPEEDIKPAPDLPSDDLEDLLPKEDDKTTKKNTNPGNKKGGVLKAFGNIFGKMVAPVTKYGKSVVKDLKIPSLENRKIEPEPEAEIPLIPLDK